MARCEAFTFRCEWKPTEPDYVGRGFCPETFRTSSVRYVHAEQLTAAGWAIKLKGGKVAHALCPEHAATRAVLMEDPLRWRKNSDH